VPLSLDDARRIVADYVAYYNNVRLHSAIGYVTPKDRLQGRHTEIFEKRDRKLAEARQRRKQLRQAEHEQGPPPVPARPTIDFAAVRAAITMASVLDLLGFQPRNARIALSAADGGAGWSTGSARIARRASSSPSCNFFRCSGLPAAPGGRW
jgi:hypothetical protein